MSAPPLDIPPSLSTSGYEDGLGRRTLIFDREIGTILERLHLRPELAAFEQSLRERMERAGAFDDERFARVRSLERDPVGGGLIVVSEFVPGNRVCDLLEPLPGADEATAPGVEAALGFLLELLPALAALHSAAGWTHGAVGPGRTVLTPAGQVVVLDALFGHALERIQPNRGRLWREFGIAMAPAAGAARFDVSDDIGQAVLTAVMIVIGRLLGEDEYPDGLPAVVAEVVEIAQISGTARFATGLHQFLRRTLPLPGRRPYATADEAATALRQLAREIGINRCRSALAGFVADTNRMRECATAAEEQGNATDFTAATADAMAEPAIEADAPDEFAFVAEEPWPVGHVDEITPPVVFADAASEALPIPPEPATTPQDVPVSALPAFQPIESTGDQEAWDIRLAADSAELTHQDPAVGPEPTAGAACPIPPEPVPPPAGRAAIDPIREPVSTAEPAASVEESPEISEEPGIAPIAAAAAQEDVPPQIPVAIATGHQAEQRERMEAVSAVAAEPVRAKSSRRQRRRGAKSDRDKLRSIGIPVPVVPVLHTPVPVATPPAPVRAAPPVTAAPTYARVGEPRHADSLPPPLPPFGASASSGSFAAPNGVVARPNTAPASIGVRVKTELPAGYAPVQSRAHYGSTDMSALPYVERGQVERASSLSWKLAAAASAVIAIGVLVAGREYLIQRSVPSPVARTEPAVVVPNPPVVATGSLVVTTQPAGARVLLDGKAAGETPLTLDSLTAGRHTLTFVTSSGTVRKTVRIEAGKTATLDVPVYSGWVAVFAPIPLDIAENGHSIGTTEQRRLMLSPGRHELTLSNRELGYSAAETVEIEPGEERSLNLQPTGELSLNALPWAEVWIDGQKAGDTPLANLRVPLGTHEIVFKHPQFADRKVTATVTATGPVAATIDFSKPLEQ